jgi:hypothetical protein
MRRRSWLTDRDEAARHPWRTIGAMFLLAWVFFTVFGYFRWTHHDLALAALGGGAFGLIVVTMCLFGIGQRRGWPAWVSGRPGYVPRPHVDVGVLWAGMGLGIAIWGATTGSLQRVLVGLPLIALGLFWGLIKRSVSR